jgi:tRNA G18 (ribose-2'-O)-methylase SpoU
LHCLLISDSTDPRLDDYRNIPDPELLRNRGIFVAEGRLVVRRLLTESAYTTRSVMVTEAAHASLADVLDARSDLPVYVVSSSLIQDISGFNIHRGCLAIGERGAAANWKELVSTPGAEPSTPRMLVVLERVANPDNVGGIFRNAAAFGADAVLLDEASTDPLYRKAIRTSMGAALVVPFARVGSLPDMLTELPKDGFVTVALTPAASAELLSSVADAVGAKAVALVLGHEGAGLSEDALRACDVQVRIPTSSAVDSLNVASAAAIGLHEFSRRRADSSHRSS